MRQSTALALLHVLFLSGSRAASSWDSAAPVQSVASYVPGSYHSAQKHNHGGLWEPKGLAIIKRGHGWQIRPECEPQVLERQNHYVCDSHGHIICMPGWEGPGCLIPVCNKRQGCGPHGTCIEPDKCSCEIGYFGTACENCVRMPGCVHGRCSKSYECNCEPGWKGPFCDVPICRDGCKGTCKSPGECVCNPGTKGSNCEQCIRTPGCVHGTCSQPFQCNCLPGWKGTNCNQPICAQGCHTENGRCSYPGECICRTGYQGKLCNKCFTYPGCENGRCEKPWECICNKGWSGPLCNKQGTYGPLNGTSSTNLNNGYRASSWETVESSSSEEVSREVYKSEEEKKKVVKVVVKPAAHYFGRSPDGEERNSRGNSSSLPGAPAHEESTVGDEATTEA